MVVTTAGSTAEVRGRRRRALALARLGELREGTWLRPDNLDLTLPADLGADLERFSARPRSPAGLAARLFDLGAWATRADDLVDRLAARPPEDWTDLAPGFVLSAAVLRHLQADPLLPADCCRPPGRAAPCAGSTTTGTPATGRSSTGGAGPPDRTAGRRGTTPPPRWLAQEPGCRE